MSRYYVMTANVTRKQKGAKT